MKKIFLLLTLFLSIVVNAQDTRPPQRTERGIDTKLIALDTLTTAQRDAITINASKGYIVFNADTNVLNVYDGSTWGEVTGGSTEAATVGEINTGTDNTKMVTPLGLAGSQIQTDVTANNAKVGVTTQISNVVEDTTPQLGGNLDVNAKTITNSQTNGGITIVPDGTGNVNIGTGATNPKVIIKGSTKADAFQLLVGGVYRTNLTGYGTQIWRISDLLNNELGDISYNSTGTGIGIVMNTPVSSQRFDFTNIGTYMSLKHYDLATGSGINLLRSNGYVGIGKNNPSTMLDINGTATATLFSGAGTSLTGTAASLTSGITNALKSATTTVNVSSATAPTTGQVLTATSGTAATWQTPSGGTGHTIQDDSTPLTARTNLNFINFNVADNSGNNATDVTAIVAGAPLTYTYTATGGETSLDTGIAMASNYAKEVYYGNLVLKPTGDYSFTYGATTTINFTFALEVDYELRIVYNLSSAPNAITDTDDVPEGSTNLYADANATNQGNTFNGVSQLVQLNGSGQLPAIDGSLLTGISGGGDLSVVDIDTSAELRAILTDEVGDGALVFQNGALGTPTSVTLTNATGLPISTGVSGLGTGVASVLAIAPNTTGGIATTTGIATLTNKTLTSPVLTTPTLGVATATSINGLTPNSEVIQIACSDLTTDITTGTSKAYFRMPYAMTLTDVRVSLLTAGTTTGITVDINEDGTTVLSTKITTDATEKTSTTAVTAPVISDSSLADDAEITIDFDAVPTGGKGIIVTLKGTRL